MENRWEGDRNGGRSPVRRPLWPCRWKRMVARLKWKPWGWTESSSKALPAPTEPSPEAKQE